MYYRTKTARAIVNWAAWSSCLQQPRPGHEHAAMFPDWPRRPTKQIFRALRVGQVLITRPPITYHLTCSWVGKYEWNLLLWVETNCDAIPIVTSFPVAFGVRLNLTFHPGLSLWASNWKEQNWLYPISCFFTTRSWNKTKTFLPQLLYQYFHDWNSCKEVRRYLKSLIATDFRD